MRVTIHSGNGCEVQSSPVLPCASIRRQSFSGRVMATGQESGSRRAYGRNDPLSSQIEGDVFA